MDFQGERSSSNLTSQTHVEKTTAASEIFGGKFPIMPSCWRVEKKYFVLRKKKKKKHLYWCILMWRGTDLPKRQCLSPQPFPSPHISVKGRLPNITWFRFISMSFKRILVVNFKKSISSLFNIFKFRTSQFPFSISSS